jgi:hypothetical protein
MRTMIDAGDRSPTLGGCIGREEVDLIVVHDHKLAERIVAALKQAGIQHVEFWPEQTLRPSRAYSGALLVHGFFRAKKVPDEGFGPFHIQVRAEDAHEANLVLLSTGLSEG